MTTKDEVLKLALEFLDTLSELHLLGHDGERVRAAIKQALAAPVQEPVCVGWDDKTDKPFMGYILPATPAAAHRKRVVFPTMLRKMWSGHEVQEWLDEHVNKGDA